MKMTKGNMRELLKDDNYLEALAFVANRIMKFKTYDGQMNEKERIYDKLIEWAYEFEEEEEEADTYDFNEYSTTVMRIDSAMMIAIENED